MRMYQDYLIIGRSSSSAATRMMHNLFTTLYEMSVPLICNFKWNIYAWFQKNQGVWMMTTCISIANSTNMMVSAKRTHRQWSIIATEHADSARNVSPRCKRIHVWVRAIRVAGGCVIRRFMLQEFIFLPNWRGRDFEGNPSTWIWFLT